MMVEVLKQAGTWHDFSEELKMSVNTGDGCSAQCFRIVGETESGPAALRGFCLLNSLLTSLSRMERVVTVEGEEGGGSEVGSCEKALALAEVGGLQLMGWGWRVVLPSLITCISMLSSAFSTNTSNRSGGLAYFSVISFGEISAFSDFRLNL